MELSPSALFAGLVFGVAGFAAWQVGRKRQSGSKMVFGLVLMVMPYLVPDPWVWLVGGLLLAGLWYIP